MPKATTNAQDTEKHDLKTCEGGFVLLRRMSYGEFLKRRNMSSGMRLEQQGKQGMQGILDLMNQKVVEYEFATCIIEHNLEDDDGELLNFKKAKDIAKLDPRVGDEINALIDKMNQFEDEDDVLSDFQTESEQ